MHASSQMLRKAALGKVLSFKKFHFHQCRECLGAGLRGTRGGATPLTGRAKCGLMNGKPPHEPATLMQSERQQTLGAVTWAEPFSPTHRSLALVTGSCHVPGNALRCNGKKKTHSRQQSTQSNSRLSQEGPKGLLGAQQEVRVSRRCCCLVSVGQT